MRLPFTPAEFFAAFSAYNTAVWPFQVLLLALAAVVCFALVRHTLDRLVLVILSALWLWMGLIYHLRFFSAINPAARLFALVFCVAAAAFAWASLRFRGPAPRPGGARSVAGWSLMAYALVGYPLLAHVAGQRYPALPTFGLPCPTTIFTLAVLLLLSPAPPRVLFVIPLLWSAVGTAAAVQLGVPEDYGLGVAGLVALVFAASPAKTRHDQPQPDDRHGSLTT
jgi:hypothetical protein